MHRLKRRLSYDQLVQRRVKKAFFLLAILYMILGGRFFYIQVIKGSHFKEKAEELTLRRIKLFARRGTIYDRNGTKLAVTVDAYDIGVRPKAIKDKEKAAELLASFTDWDVETLLAKLRSREKPFYVARGVSVEIGKAIKKQAIAGVDVLPTLKRVYPGGSLAAHIIGFCNVDGKGIAGIEQTFDKYLRGRDGYVIAERDAMGRIIPGSIRERVEPVHGKDLVLTIDTTLQHALELELKKSYTAHSAVGASAVVMDPKSGEILALANMPTFDLNKVGESDPASRRNRAVTDLYEPGSTLKTITACAGLEEGVISPQDTFHCSGSMRIGRRTIRCSLHSPFLGGHGAVDVAKILRYSCNMGAAGIGLRLGKEKLYKYEKAFGLYEKLGSGMLGEITGWHDRWQDWADVRLANIAFGQGIAVTPLQMTRAYCVVANGGLLMKPYVVKEIRGPGGIPEKVYKPRVIRRVISEETAAVVSEMLYGVTSQPFGTGKPARVEGYKVAGKTGSAQKASTTGRGYASGKFIASFVGFLPVSDPRVVILVAVDEPKGTHWGATVAAPVFQGVARKAMWHLRVPPDQIRNQPAPVAGGDSGDEQATDSDDDSGRARLGG